MIEKRTMEIAAGLNFVWPMVQMVQRLTGTLNRDRAFGREAKTLLLLGFSFRRQPDELTQLDFRVTDEFVRLPGGLLPYALGDWSDLEDSFLLVG